MNMRNACMQSLLIFVKELHYRLYFIPLSLLVSWLLPLLYEAVAANKNHRRRYSEL